MKPAKPCLACPALHSRPGPRCASCERKHQHDRNARRTQYSGTWRAESRGYITQHVEVYGWWCPGYGTAPHASNDLTCDHRADGSRAVLCRACNGRKGQAEPIFVR